MTRVIAIGIYLGIGAMFHAVMIGPQFDWSSAWTFGWLFGWPVMVVIAFWAFILAVLAVCWIVIGVCWLVVYVRDARA